MVIERRGNPGVLAGVLGCVFGVLGIFTLGIIFVPLAALCSVVGLINGLAGRNGSGIGVSLLGGALTIAGFVFSPSLWLLTGGLLVASQVHEPTTPATNTAVTTNAPNASLSAPIEAKLPPHTPELIQRAKDYSDGYIFGYLNGPKSNCNRQPNWKSGCESGVWLRNREDQWGSAHVTEEELRRSDGPQSWLDAYDDAYTTKTDPGECGNGSSPDNDGCRAGGEAWQRENVSSRNVASGDTDKLPCPVGGNTAVLRGVASQQSNGANGTIWVLKTDSPFCLTLNPPIAPRQRAILSSAEIDGQPPPADVEIELKGTLYVTPLLPGGIEIPRLSVISGKRLVDASGTSPAPDSSGMVPTAQAPASGSWYYCDPAKAYYPHVSTCSVPWRKVAPNPSANGQLGSQQPGTNATVPQPTGTADLVPAAQRNLITAVENARQQYQSASNDLAKGAARPTRARAVCAGLRSIVATNWIGKVATLTTNSDGKGVLGIDIGGKVTIKTWNNAVSDFQDHTLIEPISSVFSTASNLKIGQLVRFSGNFTPSDVDCIKESSLTLSGSIDEPEYIFRFQSITPISESTGSQR